MKVAKKVDSIAQSSPAAVRRSQIAGKEDTPSKQLKFDQLQDRRRSKQRKEEVNRKGKLKAKEEPGTDETEKLNEEKSQEVKDDKEDKKKMLRLEDRFLFTDVLYPTLQDLRVILPDPDLPNNSANVEVPSWRTSEPTTCQSADESEDMEDEDYDRRHSKMELEEKKRKRWDAQRIRELRTIERMEWKAVQKEMAKWAHIVTTYSPEPNDTKKIEVSESIPVIAFGALVPKPKNTGFYLPWFDLAQKERDETRRQTRSRASKK
ncbi:putative male-specific lethal 1-like 1 [Apostichopus japonicus]|uniref:Putative male-specific lethal 1-like 1 n=1 Tax=Stichopus japonicus TaxID=307972 RepID=A0A2G8LA52_STIJA|nr:putative male-specific lethal 1-like 1 [Apostichopus japonicus]